MSFIAACRAISAGSWSSNSLTCGSTSCVFLRMLAMRLLAALAAANKRIANILKKTQDVDSHVSELLLQEPAEIALHAAMKDIAPKAHAQFEAGDYTASLQTLAALGAPVDAFFDSVM